MNLRSPSLALLILGTPLAAEVKDLKAFYQERCSVCHGADGSGRGPSGVRLGGRNLADARWMVKQEETGLAASILRGKGAMPGFRRQLSEPEARRLVTQVIRKLGSKKNH